MSHLEKLRAAKSLDDIAEILGYKPQKLAFILYKMPYEEKYKEFQIPKRSGGSRVIKSPNPKLKLLQRRLANILYQCLDTINGQGKPVKPVAHGFARSLSIYTNAAQHKRQRYVLNLDLEDFFPSINFGRVRGVLIKDERFRLDQSVATIIAQIACDGQSLPQGSPCSPVLSNIVTRILDIRLTRLARAHKCTYSRYADDITFSTSQKIFPGQLAFAVPGGTGKWLVGPVLEKEISGSGFKINNKKTRMQYRGSKQEVTGLVVNSKVNVRSKYYANARAMCWSLFNKGAFFIKESESKITIVPANISIETNKNSLNRLEGKLEFIFNIKNRSDSRDEDQKKKQQSSIRKLYQNFLFYRRFIDINSPVILAEGNTDYIYIKASLERLYDKYPFIIDGDNKRLLIKFTKYTNKMHNIMQIGGGSGDIKFFIIDYKKRFLSVARAMKPLYPVIIIIDNDSGAGDIFNVCKNYGVNISHASKDQFYHIYENLYLVKTPESNNKNNYSAIEDLFEPSVLQRKLDGKEFSFNKKHKEAGKFGKHVFAQKIVLGQKNTIEFSGFAPLLTRIDAAIRDFAQRQGVSSSAS